MDNTHYRALAARLDELPNGFPPTEDGAELRLLARLFSAEEAALVAQLRLTRETPAQIAVQRADALAAEPHPIFGHRGQQIIDGLRQTWV